MKSIEEADIVKIIGFVKQDGPVTTQQVTEWMYRCEKPDDVYKANVEYVTTIMQWLKRHHHIVAEKPLDTGRGYNVNLWRVADGSD